MNRLLLKLLRQHPEFKISFSFSGVFLEQLERWAPEVLNSFRDLIATGQVEVLAETYYHSLAAIHSPYEFERQVQLHQDVIKRLFGLKPKVFRNTELIYNNRIAALAERLGYKAILAEGADHVLQGRSPSQVWKPQGTTAIRLLLKNYKLSDDIAFRFSSKSWSEWPLSVEKYSQWVSAFGGPEAFIGLFMDYETFGEHQWADTGIFDFMEALPGELLKNNQTRFLTPSEAASLLEPVGELDVPEYMSWADTERDLSAWQSNDLQNEALSAIYALEPKVLGTGDERLVDIWRRLQTSDHFYYMCTKWWNDGDVHKYFNPYESPYDAFIAYMNALADLQLRVETYA